MEKTLSSALGIARDGFSIVPFISEGNTKRPITKHGFKDATQDETTIKKWWTCNPQANVAIATGKQSDGQFLIVIDADRHNAETDGIVSLEKWQAAHGAFPETVTVQTGGGGTHYYFTLSPENAEGVKGTTGILPSVDIRAEGQGVVAPPSLHASGKRYVWLSDRHSLADVAPANDSVIALLHYRKEKQKIFLDIRSGRMIPNGHRNSVLYRMARTMQDVGFLDETIIAAVYFENKHHCKEPLEEAEVFRLLQSALSNEKADPCETPKHRREREILAFNIQASVEGMRGC